MNGTRLIVAALVVALAQIGFLSFMIAGPASILRDGHEVLLKIEPIDPRDMLRGDYVRLNYEISNVPVTMLDVAPEDRFVTVAGPIFVRLGRDEDGFWRPRAATLERPFAEPASAGEVDIRGEVVGGRSLGPNDSFTVQYGIDRFYVPEGKGLAIETDLRDHPLGILAAIAADGTPQIKALMDGDKKLY